jgi:hypothetical protein
LQPSPIASQSALEDSRLETAFVKENNLVAGIFRSGDKAPCSGIYKALHGKHGEPHFVTAVYGEIFPECVKCADSVQFELSISSVHVSAHPYFHRGD